MTRLVAVLQTLQLAGEIDLAGRLVKLRASRCTVYVLELAWGTGYYTWCEHPRARTVEVYQDAIAAIQAGLRRAEHLELEG